MLKLSQPKSVLSSLFVVALGLAGCAAFLGCHPQSYRRGAPFMANDLKHAPVVEFVAPDEKPLPSSPPSPAALPLPAACTARYGEPGCARDGGGNLVPQHFSLSYLEFDDGGELWSIGNLRPDKQSTYVDASGHVHPYPKSQLEMTLDLIRRKKAYADATGRRLVVIGFVHGWQNNASYQDEDSKQKNLASFKNSMEDLADNCAQDYQTGPNHDCPVVVGVFFAWRGRTIPISGVHIVSYSNRRNTANRVGGPSMTEAVMLLAIAAKGAPGNYDEANRCQQAVPGPMANPAALFVMVGHSFGGRALEHGVAQPMVALLLERKAQAEACVAAHNQLHPDDQLKTKIVPPLDLIALLNPANDALEGKSLIEAFKRSGVVDKDFDHPLIVSVKSDGDWATGRVMKWGQIVAQGRPGKRDYDRAPIAPTACQQGQLGLKPQRFYYLRSPGGIDNMGSHEITVVKNDTAGTDVQTETSCDQADGTHFLANDGFRYFWGDVPFQKPGQPESSSGMCFQIQTAKSILKAYKNQDSDQDKDQFYSCGPSLYQSDATAKPPYTEIVPYWNDTPYYVMHAPTQFIRDHDDIFQRGVFNFLMLMIKTDGSSGALAPTPGMITTQP